MNQSQPSLQVGKIIRQIRQERRLSLEQTAHLCSVSKQMLSQIEREDSIPTIAVLWKIASGLKIPLSSLLADQKNRIEFSDFLADQPIAEEDGAMRAWTVFGFSPLSGQEIFYIELDAKCRHASLPHQPHTIETILPLKGTVLMEAEGTELQVQAGNSLRFAADKPHSYSNPSSETISFYDLITYEVS